jgi:hypothetical protein
MRWRSRAPSAVRGGGGGGYEAHATPSRASVAGTQLQLFRHCDCENRRRCLGLLIVRAPSCVAVLRLCSCSLQLLVPARVHVRALFCVCRLACKAGPLPFLVACVPDCVRVQVDGGHCVLTHAVVCYGVRVSPLAASFSCRCRVVVFSRWLSVRQLCGQYEVRPRVPQCAQRPLDGPSPCNTLRGTHRVNWGRGSVAAGRR